MTSTHTNDPQSATYQPWSRAIILVDMNAFFASVEQRDNPELRGRPVVVTNGMRGSCIITSSYEARAFGIKTGMRLYDAIKLCPDLVRCPADPRRYTAVSRAIMQSLQQITPDVEVFSVDEAFLDVTHCQKLHGSPLAMAKMVKRMVYETAGILCSVGLSGDKTTAKYAAKLQKPNGLTVIPPWQSRQRLENIPATELCGIAKGIGRFLAQYGAYSCGDVARLPISVLAKRFGNLGRRIWLMCQGADPDPVVTTVAAPKSIGHGKVMPPNTQEQRVILTYLLHMSEKVAARLRRHNLQAQQYFIGLRNYQLGWLGDKRRLVAPTDDGAAIYKLACQIMGEHWQQLPVCQVQVTALDPQPARRQADLFLDVQQDAERLQRNRAIDEVNQRYGEFTVMPARLVNRSNMPNVIAPAWKPDGHRQSV